MDRRTFLATTAAAVNGAIVGLPLPGSERTGHTGSDAASLAADPAQNETGSAPDRTLRLVVQEGAVSLSGGSTWNTWSYDGQYPGPEIRVREGDRLRVGVENRLAEGTTVHWHGVPVPNAMDGVPGLTQPPIAPGEQFTYVFEAAPAGTYMYHSHVGLQLDRALLGPLIVEGRTPHVEYDREYVLVLDDFLPGPPDEGRGGMMRGPGRGMMGGQVPPYEALLVNGHRPDDPPAFEVRQGERVRLPHGASGGGPPRWAAWRLSSRPAPPDAGSSTATTSTTSNPAWPVRSATCDESPYRRAGTS